MLQLSKFKVKVAYYYHHNYHHHHCNHHHCDEEGKLSYEEAKLRLKDIIDFEIRGAILRSNCLDYEYNEKSSKYFFNLEKSKNKQKTIEKL